MALFTDDMVVHVENDKESALAGVAQWIECQPVNQRVTGSIPSLGHMPGLQARSTVEGVRKATHIDVSLPPFSSLKINK